MSAKRKNRTERRPAPISPARQQLAQARQAHAKGTMCMEDYIWSAMQCYAAELRADNKSNRHFA